MNHNAPDRKRKRLAEFDERLARESLDVHPAPAADMIAASIIQLAERQAQLGLIALARMASRSRIGGTRRRRRAGRLATDDRLRQGVRTNDCKLGSAKSRRQMSIGSAPFAI
jgi:hypothetical protein